MKKIQDWAAMFFLVAVSLLAVLAIGGIWEIFDQEVISKSFQTLGLLALVAIVIIVAGRFVDKTGNDEAYIVNPMFPSIRRAVLGVLIASASLLALLGVLAIWEVITEQEILYKSLGSLGVLSFSAFVIVLTCLQRERSGLGGTNGGSLSIGGILLLLFGGYMFFSIFRWFIF